MSRIKFNYARGASRLVVLAFFGLFSLSAVTLADDTSAVTESRTSETLQFRTGGRANNRDPQKGNKTVDNYSGVLTSKNRAGGSAKTASATASASQSASFDFWIYDADVILFNDDDRDGHYFGIDLLFDADTIYGAADVYAAVYLSLDGGPWNEYAVTDDFTVFGSSADDEYVLVTELMSGYPTGSYDLLVELFDANNGDFLASFGPEDSSGLSYLPLEDINRDTPVNVPVVVVTESGGGTTGLLLLLALAAARLRRRLLA